MAIRILLADDHALVRDGLRMLLESQGDFEVVGEASDGSIAIQLAAQLQPQIVLMDISMPELNGIDATRRIVAEVPCVKVIALTMHSNRSSVSQMLKAGASGYLLKDSPGQEVLAGIRKVMNGQVYLSPRITEANGVDSDLVPGSHNISFSTLTPREREVLQLVAEGRTTREIAARLCISVKTIEVYRSQIMDKLHIRSIAGLTKFAVCEGLTSPDP